MKHGFVSDMEEIIDQDSTVKHDELSSKVESIILDPNKIGVKVSLEAVESCYPPIIQSGGKYDIRVSAQCNKENLSFDVIICSLGARYKNYCANVSRTYMVDPPNKVENTYSTLLTLYDKCLEQMIPGNELKDVFEAAKLFLSKKDPSLVQYLPKSLGFATGLEFRDPTLLLNATCSARFMEGMVFCLSVGFQGVPLSADDKNRAAPAMQKLDTFSMLISDTVVVQKLGAPDVLTKCSKAFEDVSYNITELVRYVKPYC